MVNLRCRNSEPRISGVGQSRSFGDVASMSGLPPKAAVDQTSGDDSEVPQAAMSRCSNLPGQTSELFDHLVGAGEQRGRHLDAECFRSLEIDPQVVFHRSLHRQVGGLRAL
jgi:hypothetical protein